MPISWAVAFATIYLLMVILANSNGSSIKGLFQTNSLWPLAVFFPGLLFGKVLGFIAINCLAYVTPPLRRIFEEEVSETGRPDFSKTMWGLAKASIILGIVTLIGSLVFLQQMNN